MVHSHLLCAISIIWRLTPPRCSRQNHLEWQLTKAESGEQLQNVFRVLCEFLQSLLISLSIAFLSVCRKVLAKKCTRSKFTALWIIHSLLCDTWSIILFVTKNIYRVENVLFLIWFKWLELFPDCSLHLRSFRASVNYSAVNLKMYALLSSWYPHLDASHDHSVVPELRESEMNPVGVLATTGHAPSLDLLRTFTTRSGCTNETLLNSKRPQSTPSCCDTTVAFEPFRRPNSTLPNVPHKI